MSLPVSPSSPAAGERVVPAPASGLAALTLGAIGVVYGDIGTSPLYTVHEIFSPEAGIPLDAAHVIGAISCIVWALMLVVTLKYVILILRADNRGEGGGLALTALAAQAVGHRPALRRALLLLGVFGATLFYGDSIITPAVSVLGALEGLEVATPALRPAIVPATLVILVLLFMLQRRGTAAVGAVFGPVVSVWFLVLGVIGLVHVLREPAILAALDPREALGFLAGRGTRVLPALGAIVLALTGAEALYADMGHFGRRPIRLAWLGLVKPALVLNYMGQGALLMREPAAIENPFYRMFPPALLWPALLLATLAAIIASQAVITGAFSMTRQAMQLGFLPRMTVRHTSAHESGQIYLPMVNMLLLAGVIAAVLTFRSSSALAGAYGIAVTLTMLITTLLTFFVVHHGWRLPLPLVAAVTSGFAVVDLLLFAGCAVKLLDGGWFPLAVGLTLFLLMSTWRRGRTIALEAIRGDGLELPPFLGALDVDSVPCVPRTAVYAVADPATVPQALLHNLRHNQVLHQRNLVLTVQFAQTPWVDAAERIRIVPLGRRFWQVTLRFGFMETPDVPRALQALSVDGSVLEPAATSYFLSRETIVPTRGHGMALWREHLFATMTRNAGSVAGFFRLPDNAVVELGTRVQI
ncbi:potassium transporter Kup [Sphaerotilus uruguayifluvii]|uniref:Probable potassium transport system protein Kup n=1 Tax=Sphaerotilus uruguayifluvii TaxID=2735897 RepID=A0ABX2FYD9_9BURK|nr:KUP/HAK/KT family potassium transporter [Leptothrix sp. C29]NRT55035.1 KUP system potassium uptake protein [Leptothrix sp. C29]